MLTITIPKIEEWDEKNEKFIVTKGRDLHLEHSLISLSKWESKWHKPFYSKQEKTFEETIDYIKCMTLDNNVGNKYYMMLTTKNIQEINEYIDDPMTATYIYGDKKGSINNEPITSELIYYWMIALNINFKCEKWHLNRLITLIKVCSIKNQPPKKMGMRNIMSRNSALNAARRKKLNTNG